MNKMMNQTFFKKLHYVSILIGILTIVLPIIFWNSIPDQIPVHYNAIGVVDNWSDKSSLVLLFFAVAMMMGLMCIAVYFIKMNIESKYTADYARSEMAIVYPMLIVMNLVLQLTFAYIMFCSATCRPLGRLFLPVVLIGTFAPIVYMVYKCRKISGVSGTEKAIYQIREKQEEGEVYRSAIDWWLGLLLLGSLVLVFWCTVEPIIKEGRVDWFTTITAVITVIIILPLFDIKYVLYKEHMLISMSIYGKERVRYSDIVEMKKSYNPLSSAALSLKRLQIDYVENEIHRMILISPKKRDEFIQLIEKRKNINE